MVLKKNLALPVLCVMFVLIVIILGRFLVMKMVLCLLKKKKKKKKNLSLPLSKIPVTLYPLLQVVFGLAKLRWIARASNIICIFKLHFTTSSYIIIDVTSHGIDFYRVLKIRSSFFFFFFFFF
jgi:hypothetical protein